ncbi:acyl-[acyl-carrier-protein] thioesterase [Lachnospiraceae bacterium OttesenSCG-928-J05]|nr:acyl-[acyl-carrier-protein] thioesterase [Lachnospiraceae bacterium OttesenSCG-928-J05]
MKYSFKGRVRYSEVAADNRLSLPGIVNYFQDCSIFQSETIGHGIEFLQKEKRGWVLSAWQIVINQRPTLAEAVEVSTWATGFDKLYGTRNFVLAGEERTFAYSNSIWVYMDLEKGRPIKVEPEEMAVYQAEAPLTMALEPRKIKVPEDVTFVKSFPVRRDQIDTNNHVNNSQYISMAAECLRDPDDTWQIRAEYKKSATLSTEIHLYQAEDQENVTVDLRDATGNSLAVVEFRRRGC